VDTDLRWALLTALAAGGRVGEAEIAAESRRDATAAGRQAAARAGANIPTAEAQGRVWGAGGEPGGRPNAPPGARTQRLLRRPRRGDHPDRGGQGAGVGVGRRA